MKLFYVILSVLFILLGLYSIRSPYKPVNISVGAPIPTPVPTPILTNFR